MSRRQHPISKVNKPRIRIDIYRIEGFLHLLERTHPMQNFEKKIFYIFPVWPWTGLFFSSHNLRRLKLRLSFLCVVMWRMQARHRVPLEPLTNVFNKTHKMYYKHLRNFIYLFPSFSFRNLLPVTVHKMCHLILSKSDIKYIITLLWLLKYLAMKSGI